MTTGGRIEGMIGTLRGALLPGGGTTGRWLPFGLEGVGGRYGRGGCDVGPGAALAGSSGGGSEGAEAVAGDGVGGGSSWSSVFAFWWARYMPPTTVPDTQAAS